MFSVSMHQPRYVDPRAKLERLIGLLPEERRQFMSNYLASFASNDNAEIYTGIYDVMNLCIERFGVVPANFYSHIENKKTDRKKLLGYLRTTKKKIIKHY